MNQLAECLQIGGGGVSVGSIHSPVLSLNWNRRRSGTCFKRENDKRHWIHLLGMWKGTSSLTFSYPIAIHLIRGGCWLHISNESLNRSFLFFSYTVISGACSARAKMNLYPSVFCSEFLCALKELLEFVPGCICSSHTVEQGGHNHHPLQTPNVP